MSSEEIDWVKVAKVLTKTIGTEAARGLLYAFMSQTAYPLLIQTISNITSKLQSGQMSEEQAIRMLAEEINRLKTQGAIPQPPPRKESELEKEMAEMLEQMQKMREKLEKLEEKQVLAAKPVTTQLVQPATMPSTQPTSFEKEYLERRLKSLEDDREHYKKLKRQIEEKLYLTTNPEEKEEYRKSKAEIEQKIQEIELKIENLMRQLKIAA